MEIFFYTGCNNGLEERLLMNLWELAPRVVVHCFASLSSLITQSLQQPNNDRVYLICVYSDEELETLVGAANFFRRSWTLLILSGHDEETIKKAKEVWPRYICYLEDDIEVISLLLKKISKAPAGPADAELTKLVEETTIKNHLEA